VFTFSVHGARNFPFRKERGSLDVELPDGAGDDAFLAALELHLPHVLADFGPGLAIYLAGADPWRDDRFGRLGMSKEGLGERDRYVLGLLREAGIPTAVAMAGGYARDTEDTVDIHVATLRIAAELRREAPVR
jgi:acetoin utilization deacetylase AcuC-like enzyme